VAEPKVVVSLFARDPDIALRDARRAAMAGADWVELRLDEWPADTRLDSVIAGLRVPVIVTCRTPRDGGTYRGSASARLTLLDRALTAGAQGIDIEDWETWSPRGDSVALLIRSHHDLRGVPRDLRTLRDSLLDRGADCAKIVGRADDLADAAPLLSLLGSSDPEREPTVAFAMGPGSAATRVLACALGAPLCYASLGDELATAPGQITVQDAVGLYRVRDLGQRTRIFGVLGDPVTHSLSPLVHNRALRRLEEDGVYLPLGSARPRDVLAMLPRRRLGGFSVTAPFKESIRSVCHRLTEDAELLGAVNTLEFQAQDQIVGHNTDVEGVRRALVDAGVPPGDGVAVVLGGGGAARAGALALERLGFAVTICTRSLDRVRDFARQRGYRLGALRADVLDDLRPKVVVHATVVGSLAHGSAGERVVPNWRPLPGTFVLDMVYRPHTTKLLADCARAGAVAIPGIDMFLAQASEQIGIFTGERAPVAELGRYVAAGVW
jgi:3-dehydroquinate dehydratase/shikimate dehydrogenase